jgi:hypothetical protein
MTAPVGQVTLVEFSRALQMKLKRTAQAFGQNRDAIAQSFPVADGDMAITEIDVFDAQTHAFHETEASAIQKFCHQAVIPFEVRQNSTRLVGREHDGELCRACDALDVLDKIEFSLEHLLVKKE